MLIASRPEAVWDLSEIRSDRSGRLPCDLPYFASVKDEICKVSVTQRLQFRNGLAVDRASSGAFSETVEVSPVTGLQAEAFDCREVDSVTVAGTVVSRADAGSAKRTQSEGHTR